MRSALPPLLLCSAATAQQQVAACADLQQQTAAINEQCCGSDDAACSSGVPTSCDAGCASVFLPFLRDCPDVALPFASVVALCEATVAKAGAAGGNLFWGILWSADVRYGCMASSLANDS